MRALRRGDAWFLRGGGPTVTRADPRQLRPGGEATAPVFRTSRVLPGVARRGPAGYATERLNTAEGRAPSGPGGRHTPPAMC